VSNPDILVIVPARGGSKRLPDKNLRLLGDRSLLGRVADFLREEGLLASALLSSDDARIIEEGIRNGISAPFVRPDSIAGDTAPMTAVVHHALAFEREQSGRTPALIALLQVTSPFRRRGLLREAIGILNDKPKVQSVIAMSRLHVPASYVFYEDASCAAQPISAHSEVALAPTGALYVVRTEAFLKNDGLYEGPIHALHTSGVEAIDIDTEDDFRMAEAVLAGGLWRSEVAAGVAG
jgi:CMP-N,N'-diacetyllegionaminic acid synthase